MSSRSSKKTTSDPGLAGVAAAVEVGHVVRPHGVQGEVVVSAESEVPGRFAAGAELLVRAPRLGEARTLRIESVRPHQGRLLICFAGIDDRDLAEELRGAKLEVPESTVPEPPEGTWYHYQLVGCRCHDRRLGDLGEVTAVAEDGGGLLLVVDDGERRVPVPFVAAMIEEVDVAGRRIAVDLPEGLLEACASTS